MILPFQFQFDDQQSAVLEKVSMQTMHSITNDRPLIQLIEGPAGTGKSTLIVNLILQLLHEANAKHRRIRIFLGALNDGSVDQLALKLAEIATMMDGECRCDDI